MAEKDDYLIDILVDLAFVSPERVAELRPEAQAAGVGLVDLMLANKNFQLSDMSSADVDHVVKLAIEAHLRRALYRQ